MAETNVAFGPYQPVTRQQTVALKKFVVHFRRPSSYQQEYGFDWLRDEYIYPIISASKDHSGNAHSGPLPLSDNVSGLKNEYKTTDVSNPISPYGNDYHPAWLTMYPDTTATNSTHPGLSHPNGIDLDLKIEELEALSSDATELIFESSNTSLKISPDKIPLSSLLNGKGQDNLGNGNTRDFYLNTSAVNIKCDGSLSKHEEIKVTAKLLNEEVEVGKLMLCKNSDINDVTLKVYIIKSYLNDDVAFSAATVDAQLATIGGIPKIQEYLNQKAFNQSLIKTEVIYDSNLDWVFRKISLVNASSTPEYSGMILNQTTMEMDTAKYMNYINDRFKLKYPTLINEKALFLYITPFLNPRAGGAAYTSPLTSKHIILFKNNIDHLPSYAHEIGHTLGLEHSFEDDASHTNASEIADINNKLVSYRANLAILRSDKANHLSTNSAYYSTHPVERAEVIKEYDEDIQAWQDAIDYLNDSITVINNNSHNFLPKKTENIMDYDLSNQKVFFKWQSKIMRDEVKSYYH